MQDGESLKIEGFKITQQTLSQESLNKVNNNVSFATRPLNDEEILNAWEYYIMGNIMLGIDIGEIEEILKAFSKDLNPDSEINLCKNAVMKTAFAVYCYHNSPYKSKVNLDDFKIKIYGKFLGIEAKFTEYEQEIFNDTIKFYQSKAGLISKFRNEQPILRAKINGLRH